MTGIIDIGSNTIRLVMYDRGKQVSNTGLNSEIINDTKDGVLTSEGTEKLCDIISFFKEKAGDNEIFAFATFAFRVLKNGEEVKKTIFERTGVLIDILSGEDEAKYDFYGLMSTLCENESGIGVDLGGGSGQVFSFSDGNIEFFSSYPIGCRKVKNKFVKEKLPTSEEKIKIEQYIEEKLSGFDKKCKKLYMMGGTAKTAAKLYSFLNGSENIDIIRTDKLQSLITFIEETPQRVMKNILKNRYDSMAVGIIIMEALARHTGAEEIHIKKCGVRDGYLIKKTKL
ncbi:MAG: hypothetical protein J6C82_03870 [Clostridia bacterium]|nr:hypothetical protein [Clostridia bacterium]